MTAIRAARRHTTIVSSWVLLGVAFVAFVWLAPPQVHGQTADCTTVPIADWNTTNCTYQPTGPPFWSGGNAFPTLCNTTFRGTWNKYDTAPICILIGGVAKIYFHPQVDVFTLLDVVARPAQYGNERQRFDNNSMWITVETAGIAAYPKARRDGNPGGTVVPFWTAIITMDSGRPTSITWDDGCYGCDDSHCVMQTCSVDYTDCWNPVTQIDCDVKVYLGWYGTDANGQYLISAGKRLSQFRQYSIAAAANSAAQTGSDLLPAFQGSFTDVQLGGND